MDKLQTAMLASRSARRKANRENAELLRRALPMLERLGDFIGNGPIDAARAGSLGERCDLILDIKRKLGDI